MLPVCFAHRIDKDDEIIKKASVDFGTSWCGFKDKIQTDAFLAYDPAYFDIVNMELSSGQ